MINRVYPPDNDATGQLLAQLAEKLVGNGWKVTIVTARGAAKRPLHEERNGVVILRSRGLPFTRKSHLRRGLSYLSLYPALFFRALAAPKADRLVVMTDPPLVLFLGPFLKLLKRAHLIHWAQDVYPDIAEKLGLLKPDGSIARILRKISTASLKRYDHIIVVGRCMADVINNRGLDPNRISVVPNWADTDRIEEIPQDKNAFREVLKLEDRLVIMYSGNFGLAHPFEQILGAAEELAHMRPEVTFVFVGDGPKKEWLQNEARARSLGNVLFAPYQPLDKLSHSLSAGDVHLACMETDLCGLVVPSKVYGIMAAGRPCLFLGPRDSEAARILIESQCGDVIENDDHVALARRLDEWLTNSLKRTTAGKKARYAAEAASFDVAFNSFYKILTANELSSN